MTALVVDASVVAAAFFDEPHAVAARLLLADPNAVLYAPDFISLEIASVVWKRHRQNQIDSTEATDLLSDVNLLPLIKTPIGDLVQAALEIAMRTDRSVYDCAYLALAIRKRGAMVTADKRLVNALAASPLKPYITWLGNLD